MLIICNLSSELQWTQSTWTTGFSKIWSWSRQESVVASAQHTIWNSMLTITTLVVRRRRESHQTLALSNPTSCSILTHQRWRRSSGMPGVNLDLWQSNLNSFNKMLFHFDTVFIRISAHPEANKTQCLLGLHKHPQPHPPHNITLSDIEDTAK